MSSSGYVHLDDCTVIRITKDAILIEYEDEKFWLPKSQVADADDIVVSMDKVTVSITEWIAKQNNIEAD